MSRYVQRFYDAHGAVALTRTATLAAMLSGQETEPMSDRIKTLAQSIADECNELARLAGNVAAVKPPPAELAPLLADLAAVERDSEAYGDKWFKTSHAYENTPERRAEWEPICARKQAIVDALTRYALAAFPVAEKREAAE